MRRPLALTPPAALPALASMVLPAVVAATFASLSSSQEVARPRMEGQVLLEGVGVDTATVVLHLVTTDSGGEVDSVRVDPQGRFAFDLPSVPDPGGRAEIYFASVRRHGILYFGTAVHRAIQLDSLYTIEVHDTTVVPDGGLRAPVEVRYVVFDPAEDGWLVTDLFEIENEASTTLVPADPRGTVWGHPLPEGVRDFQLGSGDLPPDAVALTSDGFSISTPIPPGRRQFLFRYAVDDLGITIPVPTLTREMELLIREPSPPLEVDGMTPAQSVAAEANVTYRRFVASEIEGAEIVIRLQAPPFRLGPEELAVLMALVLACAGLWAVMRPTRAPASAGRGGTPAGSPGWQNRDHLILEAARIDLALSDEGDPAEIERLQRRRAVLIRRIEDLT